jgi:integrase/recombinase XerD
MSQAKTLTPQEVKQVLGIIALDKHAKRNRAMFLLTCLGGLRVGEVAQLRFCDVMDENNQVRNEIRLLAEYTKGKHARTVFVNERFNAAFLLVIQTCWTKWCKLALRQTYFHYNVSS